MRKRDFLLILLLACMVITSEDLQFELIDQITDERLAWDLDPQGSGESNGPSGITFNEEGDLIIASANTSLLLKYTSINGLETILSSGHRNAVTFAANLYTEADQYWGVDINGIAYGWYNESTGNQYSIDFLYSTFKNDLRSDSYFMSENYFFHYLDNGGIICVPHPSMDNDKNLQNILRYNEVLDLFNEFSVEEMDGLSIDEDYFLYRDGELVNRDYYHYASYWALQHGYSDFESYRMDSRHNEIVIPLENAQYMTYVGCDDNDNTYFRGQNSGLVIFNDGWCIKRYSYQSGSLAPTVDSEGYVYLFNISPENSHNITLYRSTNWPE